MGSRNRTLATIIVGIVALLGMGALLFGIIRPGAPELGRLFTASSIDADGCPQQATDAFSADSSIYVGVERSTIPRDTELFARLLFEGRPLEDADSVSSDRDFVGCVWFEFAPPGFSGGFQPGDYSAELYVNGALAGSLPLRVEGIAAASGMAGASLELRPFYSTDEVDRDGCPQRALSYFQPEDEIYISAQASTIPMGTEIFVRLIFQGNPLEDSEPLVADQDLETCIWVVFDRSGGFEPGNYQAEVYVDGAPIQTVRFEVE